MTSLANESLTSLVLAIVLLPFAGAALIGLAPQRAGKWLCQLFAAIGVLLMGLLALRFAGTPDAGAAGTAGTTTSLIAFGTVEVMGLVIDRVSVLIGAMVVVIGFLVAVYSASYLNSGNREHADSGRRRYYAFLLMFIGAMSGLVFSSTILGQLFFFELTGGCSWALIGYYESPKALRSAAKALIITHIASFGLYVAAALLFVDANTFALSGIAQLSPNAKTALLLAVLFAAWGKSAQVPMHMWLPDAMEAPTPVSAYLHAASMVKVGVYIYARALMSADGVPPMVGWVGATMAVVTLIYGFSMYLPQTDMKRLLAYSTITQLAYIFLGLSLSVFGSTLAFKGAIAHMFNHAFAKTLFFLVAGTLAYVTGTRQLPALRGLITRLPLVGIAFVAAAMAISGVPPFSGFFSKFAIFAGGFAVSQGEPVLWLILAIALAESVGCFAWFLRWIGRTVPGKPSEAVAAAAPVPPGMKFVLVVLVVMSLASSFIAAAWLG